MSVEGLAALYRRLNAVADTGLRRDLLGKVALRAVDEAKTLVPRKTGNLGRSIRLGRVSDDSAEVLAGGIGGVGYARYVEFGTRAHVIRPRNRRVLRWSRGGRRLTGTARSGTSDFIYARQVNHPGTRAQPYLRPGVEKALAEAGFREPIVKAWNDAA